LEKTHGENFKKGPQNCHTKPPGRAKKRGASLKKNTTLPKNYPQLGKNPPKKPGPGGDTPPSTPSQKEEKKNPSKKTNRTKTPFPHSLGGRRGLISKINRGGI